MGARAKHEESHMRRVVVTGLGVVSCLGNSAASVVKSLRDGRSGISHSDTYQEMGFRSHVRGRPEIDLKEHIDRKALRFMGDAAAWSYIAMQQAIADAGLEDANCQFGQSSGTITQPAIIEATQESKLRDPLGTVEPATRVDNSRRTLRCYHPVQGCRGRCASVTSIKPDVQATRLEFASSGARIRTAFGFATCQDAAEWRSSSFACRLAG